MELTPAMDSCKESTTSCAIRCAFSGESAVIVKDKIEVPLGLSICIYFFTKSSALNRSSSASSLSSFLITGLITLSLFNNDM